MNTVDPSSWDLYNGYCFSSSFYYYLETIIIIIVIIFTPFPPSRRNEIIKSLLLMLLEPDRQHDDKLRLVLPFRVNNLSP